ncbi:3-phosphoshikimate 1-carboxyvinyltransferase [Cryobacterium sp. BB736]|uniref:3-phosphoshikimate 1-carboxyvinyltransferase n=1 Tax=Cryobacterium sp. BB736 TaxID=2746963 RepID=UPI001875FB84|nr:3-phosphoshikimate 1-carboxyvinyltransferase [Cryobacterium sp. BB736]
MLTSRYSKPEFNPYGNDDPDDATENGPWHAPRSAGPLSAHVSLPGSKSLTNRELVLSAVASGPSRLRAPLHSRDTALMVQALKALGVGIEETPGTGEYGPDLVITPGELSGGASIDCGLAGTVMRFVPPLAALALGPVAFDGDPHARKRPMRTTIDSLRRLGVSVSDDGRGTLPFSLYGTGRVAGGTIEVDASASSQFVSALLLVGARFDNGLELRHTGDKLPSLPHIDMTIATLAGRGVRVENPSPGVWIVPPSPVAGLGVTLEPDLSNAAPFLAAALVASGSVTVQNWPDGTSQVGAELERLLPLFGGVVTRSDGNLTVEGSGTIHGVELDLSFGGELVPALVALAALADGPSRFTGIGHLRGHETDRLDALATEVNALGGKVTVLEDGLAIDPQPLHGGLWRSYEDHRMATTGAIIGLAVDGVAIDDIGTTAKTLPEFPELWQQMIRPSAKPVDPLNLGLM